MMAVLSSHTLNALDGSHAGGIEVRLTNLETGETVFEDSTDEGGRLLREVPDPDPAARYEMVFRTGNYWKGRMPRAHGTPIMDEIVLRFAMPDPRGRYHMPLILSPHACSLWCSNENG